MPDAAIREPAPLVTAVVPCYNHARFVERSVRSVLDQTYPTLQLVVIDDGSSDGSVPLLKRLSDTYGFELICQENRGICRTLNRAIRGHAHGEYVALLASDDLWHPEKIAQQVADLQGNASAEFCFTQAIEFRDETRLDRGRVFPRSLLQGQVLGKVFLRQHVPAGSMLFSRRLYDQLGGFDEDLREEDWDFVIRCAAETEFVGVPKPLLYYRAHAENTMRTRDRVATFHQKALILTKNYQLVSPWRWLVAILVHFSHDIILQPMLTVVQRR